MTSSKYCLKIRDKIKLPNAKKLESEQDHDLFISKLTSALCCETFSRLPLNTNLGRLPLSELAEELKTGKLMTKFEDFDYYTEGEDESPYVYTCSFVLAIMYFERLKVSNPSYLKSINSSELFLISLLVASKYLHDDGELDSAINSEWAAAYGISVKTINQLEKDYLSAMNWEIFISDEEFTVRHKQIVLQLYGDIKKTKSVLLKVFLLVSSVIKTIRKIYRRKIVKQKIKQMIAMSTLITVVTATTMQLKFNSGNEKLVRELFERIDSDPNYPIISSSPMHLLENIEQTKEENREERRPSKLVQLLEHLLLMNTCLSNCHKSPYQHSLSKLHKDQFHNITHYKDLIFFKYLTIANCTS